MQNFRKYLIVHTVNLYDAQLSGSAGGADIAWTIEACKHEQREVNEGR